MDRSDGGKDFKVFAGNNNNSSDTARFDASQYEFFGRNVLQEVELGGLEDNEDNGPAFGPADDEYHLFDKEEGVGLGSLADVDDLATTFAKVSFLEFDGCAGNDE